MSARPSPLDDLMQGEQEADDLPRVPRNKEGFASIEKLRAWHREGTAHYLTYKKEAEEEEAAVFGEQWSKDEIAYLKKNGRIDLVFNHIQKNVLAVDGYRAENRSEFIYLPKEASDTEEAEVYTQLAKHYFDACLGEYELDRGKLQQYIGPFGAFYVGHERDDPSKEPFKIEFRDWRSIRYDPKGKRLDGLDWRYVSVERWGELEEEQARFPEHAEALAEWAQQTKENGDSDEEHEVFGGNRYSTENTVPLVYLTERKEVRIVETWYRIKKAGLYVKTPTGWEVFDEHNVDHQLATILDPNSLKPGQVDCVYYATWCGKLILEEGKTDYDHKYFPIVFMWGLRDGKGKPQGAVHAQMDPQKTLNWARSKMQWQANANRWTYPDGSIEDIATWKENAARPDALLPYQPTEGGGRPELIPHGEEYRIQRDLAQDAQDDLNQIGGSPDAMRGQQSQEISGRAIARKQEGALRQQGLWFREAERAIYQIAIMWRSMIAAKVTDEVIVRIRRPNGQMGHAAINVEDPLRRQELEAQGYQVYGSITRLNYDTKVVVSPLSATVRERQAQEQAMANDILSPEQAAAVAPIRILATDMKDKEKMAERLEELRAASMPQPMAPPGAFPVGPDGLPVAPPPPPQPPEMSAMADTEQPPEQMPGGFPLDPLMQDPSLMAGEMTIDGGGYA